MRNIKLVVFICLYAILSYGQVEPLDPSLERFLNVRDFTLSTDLKEAYFTVQSIDEQHSIIVKTNLENGHWDKFEMVRFSGEYRDIEPFLSPDNLRLYFSSNRPKNNSIKKTNYDIWYVKRKSMTDDWSEPINIGAPVNTESNEFYPSISNNNNIYFTSDAMADTRKDDIFFSKWNGQKYLSPVPLSDSINSDKYEFNAFISPNENFIIYTVYNAPEGLGSGDIFISYKTKNGNFAKRKSLGDIVNSDKMEYCPFYDINKNVLYFTSKRNDVNFNRVNGLKEFENNVNQYKNGLSRIYKISIKL